MTHQDDSSLEAKQFIEALFSGYFKDHDGYVEVRAIGETTISKWLLKGEITEIDWQEISRLNKTCHIYFGVNPRPLSKEKKERDFQSILCLWADVDGKDFAGGGKDAALVILLPAGNNYTAQVKGADGGTGEALVEIYELP